MKFANIHSVVISGRFALRLAFFSFLCLLAFAMSSPRFGIAPAAGAANTTGAAQTRKHVNGKSGKAGAVRAQAVARETGKSEDKGAVKSADGDAQPLTVCAQNQPISFGQTVDGVLSDGDCLNPVEGDGSRVDEYTFSGTAGQQVTINLSSTAFDTVLYLLRPNGSQLAFNDDIDRTITPPNQNSRIVITLPESGVYSILANSFAPESRGAYKLSLITTGTCNSTPIAFNQTLTGTLGQGDCTNSIDNDGTFTDLYTFQGVAGQQVSITMTSTSGTAIDPYLYLLAPDASLLADDDNGGGGTIAHLPQSVSFGRLPMTGTYTIVANTVSANQSGSYSITLARAQTDCASVPLTSGTTVNGSLVNGDCRLLEDGSFIDAYTFTGTAGGQVSITMTSSSAGLTPVLFLLAPTGAVLTIDVNSSGTTARIPDTGTFTLPVAGTYTVLANSFATGQTGNYSLQVVNSSAPACTTTLAAAGRDVVSSGGPFSVAFTTQAGCAVSATSNAAFITVNSAPVDSNGAGSVSYTVQANPTAAARTGTITINGQTFTVTQAGMPVCTTTLAAAGRDVIGSGATFSVAFTTQAGCPVSATSNAAFITVNAATVDGNGAGSVTYTVQLNPTAAARTGTITINSQTFTVTQAAGSAACTYAIYPTVRAFTANGSASGRFTVITQNGCPWSATTTAPWIAITEGAGTTTGTGRVRYTVLANESNATRVGTITVGGQTHTVTQTSAGTTPQIQFTGNAEFTVNENDPSRAASITVTRTGDTAGAATVEYATLDDQAAVPCDPNIKNGDVAFPQGTAYARCDYATTIDTLTFNPGETTKTLTVPLINDVFQEGNERFRIGLSNPQGATLGTLTTAIITIQSEDTAPPTTNPINQTAFFVRQQYLDFLDREPEPGEPWTAVLNRCGNIFTGPEVNTDCDRIAVSGAFFGSPEFRIKGFFVFLHYKAVFGSANNPLYVPEYNEFVTDARRVSGLTAEEVIAKRLDFTEDFFARTAVANVFSGTSNEAFVDRVLANLGITLANPDSVSGETRNSLVAALNSSTRSRAQVLRIIVESTEAIAAQFNRAFVAIQYYGYLRRTPEPQGYQNNLNALNATNNSRRLIDGFLNSIEYRLRFGANTTNP